MMKIKQYRVEYVNKRVAIFATYSKKEAIKLAKSCVLGFSPIYRVELIKK